ncbi:NUDIX hydrolase [Massilia phyllosphaerae]|uniref:NUDIX hydrolase n=1 Tax=Massilia phyllosphaerae TaxID=3106034 RepID=UPI002B1CC16B|nr:NUDIX hydrolase [Massilia sp. SGZ-792]
MSSGAWHPHPDENGKPVLIRQPSLPTPSATWADPACIATVIPGGDMPAVLNGIAVSAQPLTLPADAEAIAEPPFVLPPGMRAAAGAVVVEDDGRVWLVSPSNGFGGYSATFPKGRLNAGGTLQYTAVREVFEESGLVVRLEAYLLDVSRTQTHSRYYLARRVGGNPAQMGWESQAVHLVPAARLQEVAVHPNDVAIIRAVSACILRALSRDTSRDASR